MASFVGSLDMQEYKVVRAQCFNGSLRFAFIVGVGQSGGS